MNLSKRPTIVDIANKVGITPSAVSKALNNHPRISAATREAVLKAAKELHYHPNSLATGLRKRRSGLIGILVPAIHYSFFATAIKGAEEILSAEGYNVIIAQSKDQADVERKQLEGFLRAQVEGIIASIAAGTRDFSFYRNLSTETPLVLFDRTLDDEDISSVTVDDFNGAIKAVDHLVEMGYTKIAHLAGYSHVMPFGKRIDGYKSAMKKYQFPIRSEYIIQCAPNKDEGARAMERLLQLSDPPDAIFAASDYLAFGAIKALKNHNVEVPRDFGIVGFSNEEFSSQVSPSITTVDQFSETMGSAAARLLLDQLSHSAKGNSFVAQKRILSPKLIIRQSSAHRDATVNPVNVR